MNCSASTRQTLSRYLRDSYHPSLLPRPGRANPLARYRADPEGYAREVLKVGWWSKQAEIARLLAVPPYRVLVKACHEVGKTYLAGSLVNWWYDANDPGLVLTTAPTDTQVRDLLWKEVRAQRQRAGRGGFRGPKMPRLESGPRHWAHGFTARDADAFQGRHEEHVLVVFDEAVGVAPEFWDAAESMATAWLAIFNPTDPSSQAYTEEHTGGWHVVSLSALEHPNIAAELAGRPPPYPAAIRLGRLEGLLKKWCAPVVGAPSPATDVEWPPGSGNWLRPGPLAESRLLGRWPSQGSYGVWSDALWAAAELLLLPVPAAEVPELGCDVARYGDDWTAIHARCGPASLHHESANGWGTTEVTGRLIELARRLAEETNRRRDPALAKVRPEEVPVKVDDDGVGGGVVDLLRERGFYAVPVNAGTAAAAPADYPNRRSELWFATADRAREGRLSLARLPAEVRQRLRQQAMAPRWKLDSAGRRVVERKEETKAKLGRSPDDLDALNLAYQAAPAFKAVAVPQPARRPVDPRGQPSAAERRGLYGR